MKLSLVVASGVHEGKAIPVTVPQFAIGRDPQCQLRPASPSISKRHCALFVKGKQVLIRDFGSTNGTFVNGTLVEGEVPLKDGDEIKVGPLEFRVSISLTAAAPKPEAVPAAATPTLGDPPADGETIEIKADPSDEDKLAALLLDDDGAGKSQHARAGRHSVRQHRHGSARASGGGSGDDSARRRRPGSRSSAPATRPTRRPKF